MTSIKLVSVSSIGGTRHQLVGPTREVVVPVEPAASRIMVTGQVATLHDSDPNKHSIETQGRSWVSCSQPVGAVRVSWAANGAIHIDPHPPRSAVLRCCTAEVAAANKQDRADLKQRHKAVRAQYGKQVLRHGLMNPLYMLTAAEPNGEPPSLHAGAALLGGIQGSPALLCRVFSEACGYAEACLCPLPPRCSPEVARGHVCLALGSLRGMYQTEDRDDRAFTFGMGQDCDDQALLMGGYANAFTRILRPSAVWRSHCATDTERGVMAALQTHTPMFAHVIAHPPHPLPDGQTECGHVVCIMSKGLTPEGQLVDPYVVEPTAPSVPPHVGAGPPTADALQHGLCRVITPDDYRRLFFVATEDGVHYFLSEGADGKHADGVDANWALGLGERPADTVAYKGVHASVPPTRRNRSGERIHQFMHLDDAVAISRAVLWPAGRTGSARSTLSGTVHAWCGPVTEGALAPLFAAVPPTTGTAFRITPSRP